MNKGSAIISWILGITAALTVSGIASSFGLALRNESINATQTANITNLQDQFKGLREVVAKEVQLGVQQGIQEGVKEFLKEMDYQKLENQKPAVIDKKVPLVKSNGSPQ